MHYKDGTKAQLGDLVRGVGYNIKHEIHGQVVGLKPGETSCNIHLVTLRPSVPLGTERHHYPALIEEHGSCDAFELVFRPPSL